MVGILCNNFPDSLGIADLGCSSGPNTLTVICDIIDIVHATSFRLGRPIPEFRVSLNDLPGNDFNDLFKSLPEFYNKLKREKGGGFDRCFIAGVPGSFYGRLFPNKSLHFVHSSSSLHWLSQVRFRFLFGMHFLMIRNFHSKIKSSLSKLCPSNITNINFFYSN